MQDNHTSQDKLIPSDFIAKKALKLLSLSLGTTDEAPDLCAWPDIQKELEAQTVLPLVSNYVLQSDINPEDKLALSQRIVSSIRRFHKVMKAQTALFDLFKTNTITATVMKGSAAAQYYPKPELRQFGDIDVLVLPEDYDRAFELLKQNGYNNHQQLDDLGKRHIGFTAPDGTKIELHRFFSSSLNDSQNSLLDGWLYEGLGHVQTVKVNGYEASVLPTLENGLVLLGHINQHLCDGLGLRQIIDWMMYVRTELSDTFWWDEFKEKAEAIGMRKLAETVTKMCQMYLGLDSDITWCKGAEEKLAEELMQYILQNGNFGQKKDSASLQRSAALRRYYTNPVRLFKNLTEAGMICLQKAGKKPRKAYAWLYEIGRMVYLLVSKQRRIGSAEEIRNQREDLDFLKRLEVTRL